LWVFVEYEPKSPLHFILLYKIKNPNKI